MYKILIVEDEEFVRTSIVQLINWRELGFSVVLQAENGAVGLETAIMEKPDLVLADIRMPEMDGLSFTMKLKEILPETVVAFMTGYDDIDYAKKGIEMGIARYISKPIGIESLTKILKELKEKLDKMQHQKNYLEKTWNQLHQSLPLLKERYYKRLVYKPSQISQLVRNMQLFDIPLPSESFSVCILAPDFIDLSSFDIELYNYAIKNLVNDTLGGDCPLFFNENGQMVIVFSGLDITNEQDEIEKITEILNIIKTNINSIFGFSITAALGTIVSAFENLNQSYNEALSALDCRYLVGNNQIYYIKDIGYHAGFYYPADTCTNLIEAVKTDQENEIEAHLNEITEFFETSSNVSPNNIKLVYAEIAINLLKLMTQLTDLNQDLWKDGFKLFESIQKNTTIRDMSLKMMNFAQAVAGELKSAKSMSNQLFINKVISFIKKNYFDENLKLTTAAANISISSGYLSALFKKETGQNFSDFLTQVRIDNAKYLLKNTDKKTYEIAFETGFSNPNYFSYAFKKNTGLSPSEYKDLNNK